MDILAAVCITRPHDEAEGADVLNWLLDHGAVLAEKDIREAAWRGNHEDVVLKLIEINRDATIKRGCVHTAVMYHNAGMARVLLEAGASPNGLGGPPGYDERETAGSTPLIECVYPTRIMKMSNDKAENVRSRLAIARLLLEHGVCVEERGWYGETAVSWLKRADPAFTELFREFGLIKEKA